MFFIYEFSDRFRNTFPFHTNNRCSNIFGKVDVRVKGALVGLAAVLPQVGVYDKKIRVHTLCHAGAAGNQISCCWIGTDADRDPLADGNRFSTVIFVFLSAMAFEAKVNLLCHLPQRQFSQSNQICLSEKIPQCASNAFLRIDISSAHPVLQGFRSQIDHHNFIDPLQHPVRNSFAHLDAGDLLHGWSDALQMLDIHGGKNVDSGIQQFEHVFVSLGMLTAFNIRVSELIDQSNARFAGEENINVHLFKLRAFVINLFARHHFQTGNQFSDSFSSMRFHNADHNIFAASMAANSLRQHRMSLADAGSIAKKELKNSHLPLRGRTLFQPLIWSFWHRDYCR